MQQPFAFSCVPMRAFALLLCAAFLCSCASFQLHDESRAKLAASGKQDYAAAKVTEVVEADRKNAEFLLAAEITAVRENFAIQVDIATLEIANNSTPMSATYKEAGDRIKELGFDSITQLRTIFHADANLRAKQRTFQSYAKVMQDLRVNVPDCVTSLADLTLPTTMTPDEKALLTKTYPKYQKLCAELRASESPPSGLIAHAYDEWQAAKKALAAAERVRSDAAALVAAARTAYDQTVKDAADAKNKGKDFSNELAEKAKTIAAALDQAKKLNLGVENAEEIDALVEILTAVAGGDVDPKDPNVARAAAVAKQIPLLAEDIAQLEATRTAPPVSGLLLALRHKTLLADAARRRTLLAEERVNILKAKYDAYSAEADHWLRFHDATCSYAVLSGQQKHPGLACNDFVAPNADGVCMIFGKPLPECALRKPWKEALRTKEQAETKRELYKAVTNYLQALALQAVPVEETFREIDVRQRETLLAKRNALETWDNLVSVPIDQLDGYYQGGVKPAEIADLILRALTFTAIAIGVSK